jgi:hypothetical protein
MKRIIATALVALSVASPAWAGFIANRVQWNALGSARQADYVMGIVDQTMLMDATSPYGQANAQGILDCMVALNLDNIALVTIIDEGYARSASTWGDPPVLVLTREFTTVCRTYMNEERVSRGLAPFPGGNQP